MEHLICIAISVCISVTVAKLMVIESINHTSKSIESCMDFSAKLVAKHVYNKEI